MAAQSFLSLREITKLPMMQKIMLEEKRWTAAWLLIQNQQVLLQRSRMLSLGQNSARVGNQKWRPGRTKATETICLHVS